MLQCKESKRNRKEKRGDLSARIWWIVDFDGDYSQYCIQNWNECSFQTLQYILKTIAYNIRYCFSYNQQNMEELLKLKERIDIAIEIGESYHREFKSALEGPPGLKTSH